MVLAALGAFQPDDQGRCAALRCAQQAHKPHNGRM
jgi:hypothetical protein